MKGINEKQEDRPRKGDLDDVARTTDRIKLLVGSKHFDESSATHEVAMFSNWHPPLSLSVRRHIAP